MIGLAGLLLDAWEMTEVVGADRDNVTSVRKGSKKSRVQAASDRFVDLFRRAAIEKLEEKERS